MHASWIGLFCAFFSLYRCTLLTEAGWISNCKSNPSYGRTRLFFDSKGPQTLYLPTSETTVNIIPRKVPISDGWSLTVWEWERPTEVIENYYRLSTTRIASTSKVAPTLLDPFGLVTWPGAVIAAQELLKNQKCAVENATVVVLGAGVGLEAQAAGILGAQQVIALDIHPTTLQLLEYGMEKAGLPVTTEVFDLFSADKLPVNELDTLIVADVLYNEQLAQQVALRCAEAAAMGARVLVSDSQRFVDHFADDVNRALKNQDFSSDAVQWKYRRLESFTGSGILVEQDQTYEVKARVMWIGL